MFKDGEVASIMVLGITKCSYLINFGWAPFFYNVLKPKIHA